MTDLAALPDEIPCVNWPASADELDEVGYLAANPDAIRAGLSAKAHFRQIGQREHRAQWINRDTVARMRAAKLAMVRWRGAMPMPTEDGVINGLSAETVAAFGIPDEVPVSAHQYGQDVVDRIRGNPRGLCLDVGAGLRHTYYRNVVNTDIYRSICTDVMCVGEDLPFADDQFDTVFCFAVLEHTMRPWDVAREMCRVLKPGGTIMVDWPFLQPVHGYPHHYFNATPRGNASLFEPFCDITALDVQWHHHPAIAVRWILTAWRDGLPPAVARRFEAMPLGTLIHEPLEQQLAQEWCHTLHPELKRAIASGSLMVGVKRPGAVTAPPDGSQADGGPHARAQEIEDLRNTIAVMRASRSWRITAPLRAAARAWRAIRGGGRAS